MMGAAAASHSGTLMKVKHPLLCAALANLFCLKSNGFRRLIRAAGAKLIVPLQYSSVFDPIAQVSAKLKHL